MISDWTYDPAGRLDRIDHAGPAGVIDFFDYDPAGNRTSMTSSAGVETYTINLLNQLTGVSYPDGSSTAYSYDPAGNRLTETTAGTTISYVYDDASRLASIDGVGNSYDGAGNLLFDGTNTYGWDWQSRLITADDGMTSTSYGYDGDHVRVTVDGQARLYDRQGWTGLPELVSTGTSAFTHSPEGVINQIGATTTRALSSGDFNGGFDMILLQIRSQP